MSATDRVAAGPPAAVTTADDLTRFAREVFVRAGMSEAQAGIVADVLVWADLRGVESHGVMRIPRYLELIDAGDLNPRPVLTVATETAAAVLLDADSAAGPVAMTSAMTAAVGKARQSGVGLALVRATAHTAALGYYTLMAARQGMAGIALSGSSPLMVYHGARAAGVSTSPISIAVPGGEHEPLVLDMGTGLVSMGKLMQVRKTGQPIPEGWALDAKGRPTTDPQAARIPLPLGGPKGSGLALLIECLTSLVVSNPLLAEALEGTARGRRHRMNGLTLAIDVGRFGDPDTFRTQVDRLVKALKALPRAADVVEILMPGEGGSRTRERRRRDGIPIPRAVLEELQSVGDRLGVALFASSPPP